MANPTSYFRPAANPVNVPFRPLRGGMRPDLPPTSLDPTQVLSAQGVIAHTTGLRRTPGAVAEFNGAQAPYPPVLGYSTFFELDGTEVYVVWDSKFLYAASGSGFTGVYSSYSVGTAKTSGTLLVATATAAFTSAASDLKVGDIVAVGAGASLEMIAVAGLTSTNVITLASTPTLTHLAGSAYAVRRSFAASAPEYVDAVEVDNKIVMTDRVRPLQAYNGANFGVYDASLTFFAGCVAYHADRLWAGRITDDLGVHNQRVMWSSILDRTDFGIVGVEQFVDRPYAPGALLRLVPLGPYLVAYYEDAIDFGRPTQIAGDDLPISFADRLQTGGIGLIGPRAITPWLDGHFFVGQDDIYYLGLSGGFERIGLPVIERTIRRCLFPGSIWVVPDVTRNRIVFGFPESTPDITKLWSFNYLTKAWSFEDAQISSMGAIWGLGGTISALDALSGTISGLDSISGSIAGLGNSIPTKELIIGDPSGYVWRTSDDVALDKDGNPIRVVLETGDFDFNEPDKVKSGYRVSLKIDRTLSDDVAFVVEGSTNEGVSWTTLGMLTISAGRDEAYVNFALTGSTLRFRFTSVSEVPTYVVLEYVVRLRGRGLQAHSGATD